MRRTGLERMIVDPRPWVPEEAQRALAALERKGIEMTSTASVDTCKA